MLQDDGEATDRIALSYADIVNSGPKFNTVTPTAPLLIVFICLLLTPTQYCQDAPHNSLSLLNRY